MYVPAQWSFAGMEVIDASWKAALPRLRDQFCEAVGICIMSKAMQALILCLMILQLVFLILEMWGSSYSIDNWLTVAIAAIFFLETFGHLMAQGVETFFASPWNVLDFAVVILSTFEAIVIIITEIIQEFSMGQGFTQVPPALRPVLRLQRFIKAVQILRVARTWVSNNKARFVDQSLGINIDLVHITKDVIAMSVPATGVTALYRNPIGEVVRFFETKYPDNYRIYNACPELPYPASKFNNQVRCFDIQDHSPPSMDNIFDFLLDATEWMSEQDVLVTGERVIAIHCKGGKGRTGTFCCAWFLYTRTCETLEAALELFATKRTDQTLKGKQQGVETKGQIRYLGYVDVWLRSQQMYSPAPSRPPPDNIVTITQVRICQMLARNASKFKSALLVEFRNPSWRAGQGPLIAQVEIPFEELHAQLTAPDGEQVVTIDLGEDVWVQGDFRIDVLASRWNVSKRNRCIQFKSAPEETEPVRPSARFSSLVSPWRYDPWGEERRNSQASSVVSDSVILETDAQVLKKRVEAGKVAGLWIYAHIHSSFMGEGPVYTLQGADLDVTKLQKKVPLTRLNPTGRLEFEFQIEQ